jgi:hypothetical protein
MLESEILYQFGKDSRRTVTYCNIEGPDMLVGVQYGRLGVCRERGISRKGRVDVTRIVGIFKNI